MMISFLIIGLVFIGTGMYLLPITPYVFGAWLIQGIGAYLIVMGSILHICDGDGEKRGPQ